MGPDGESSLLISAGQKNQGIFVAEVDLETGESTQYSANWDKAAYVTTSYRSLSSGVLYMGSGYAGHLRRFDLARPEHGLEDMGVVGLPKLVHLNS